MSYKYETVVFIGRMQPAHNAHLKLIEESLKLGKRLIIAIGSCYKPKTIKNPWSGQERIHMMESAVKEYFHVSGHWKDMGDETLNRISFVELRDHLYNNTRWATHLYSQCIAAGASQNKKTCLIGCFKDDSSFYLKMFPQWSLETFPVINHEGTPLSSTDIRDELLNTGSILKYKSVIPNTTYNLLKHWYEGEGGRYVKQEYEAIHAYKKMWEKSPYPPTFVTTDTVVIKSGHILLIKRKFSPGKGLWALPGGFLDKDTSVKESAIRELKEETKIKVDKIILEKSIKDQRVFDHPKRSLRGRTITHAFLIDLEEGPLPVIKASDDAEGAHWIPMADIFKYETLFFEDHLDIIQHMTSKV